MKCKNCGKISVFLLQGLCNDCRKAEKEKDRVWEEIKRQVQDLSNERNAVLNMPELTPKEINGYPRSYHYKDVNVYVGWQYSGQYGKTCKSIGMKRGQHVELVQHPKEEDPSNISILWKNKEVAKMKDNRLRGMVHQWLNSELPVQCIVAFVGGEQKLLLEFAFYGKPGRAKT